MCPDECQLVAQTQDYKLVHMWCCLVKFQEEQVVLKFDVLPHWNAVFCAVCIRAISVANVPSQQAVKLVVLGPRLSTGSSCIQEFIFEVRFYFTSKKGL